MAGVVSIILGVGFFTPMTTAHAAPAPARAAGSSTNVLDRRTSHLAYTNTSTSRVYAGGPPPLMIGVDATPPGGKNWNYIHYFPESGVSVAQGGLILFAWNQGQNNGLHSVTVVPSSMTLSAARSQYPTAINDTDNGEHDVVIPASSNNGTDPTCSTGPTAPPCVFDNTKVVSSGIIPTGVGAAYALQISATVSPGTYSYFCVIHPGMSGSFNVVPTGGSDPNAVAAAAASEKAALDAGAAAAEAANSVPTFTTNANGTRNWKVHTGVSADDVELLEFLPLSLPIKKGDTVTYDASLTTQEPHTATTGAGFAAGMVPFMPNQCESATGPDTLAAEVSNGPPQLGCADPSTLEQGLIPAPQGPNVIANGGTATSSGIISGRTDILSLGGQSSYTYSFPNEGTYYVFCAFHSGMVNVVNTPGYRLAGADAGVADFGALSFHGSQGGQKLSSPVTAFAATQDNQGYWLVSADGHTANFGGAAPVGNINAKLKAPIVGAAATPDNQGLWLAASDGGVFALGSATFMGSAGGVKLKAPVVGIATDGSGAGYDLVASDGGVFNYGVNGSPSNGPPGPRFFGSLGGVKLNQPIVGIADAPDSMGYTLVASDGGVFTFGPSSGFFGGLGGTKLAAPIVGIALTGDFHGYRLTAADGGVFSFGDAGFFGSLGGIKLGGPIIGITGT